MHLWFVSVHDRCWINGGLADIAVLGESRPALFSPEEINKRLK